MMIDLTAKRNDRRGRGKEQITFAKSKAENQSVTYDSTLESIINDHRDEGEYSFARLLNVLSFSQEQVSREEHPSLWFKVYFDITVLLLFISSIITGSKTCTICSES